MAGNGAAPVVASRGSADYTGTGSAMQSPPLLSETLTQKMVMEMSRRVNIDWKWMQ